MTAEQQIARIVEIIKKYDFDDVTKNEFEEGFEFTTIAEIKENMWELYCFMSDVVDTINM